jgi:hypothetical protein
VEVKKRIAIHPSTALPVREKAVEAALGAPPPSPPTGSRRVRDPSLSQLLDNKEEEIGQSPALRCRQHDAREYSEDDSLELEVKII